MRMHQEKTMPDYEFSAKKLRVEKTVATVVDAVPSEEVEKAVAEEIKVADPVNADEVLKAASKKVKEEVGQAAHKIIPEHILIIND